ncbi:zinc finger protein 830 [Uranotaenia lowii]|uniref:zinc finger protein 830 n=1 Tax=Uranotaenia lowii TaxID=190385 RepID=UPI002479AC8A|nr:zinc finger protein 830 [Uranotaenia lowii]
MSAAFKLAKKKYTQQDLRRIMSETKATGGKTQTSSQTNRIDSPLAKYNESGQLTCALCRSVVRSEAVWKVHINSKQHRENIEEAKKLKEKIGSQPAPVSSNPQQQDATSLQGSFKRPSSPNAHDAEKNKKVKGILKNYAVPNETNKTDLPSDFFDSGSKINKNLVNLKLPSASSANQLPKDLKDPPEGLKPADEGQPQEPEAELPEGFFDDPKADAKARNIEYRDPNDEEWERFQKEIKEATTESMAIINEEQEESTTERQISEIDEQIRNWSRVLDLERKKDEVRRKTLHSMEAGERMVVEVKKEEAGNSDEDDDDGQDFEEFPDWRAKKSFK